MGDEPDDPDRAAILGRRNRLIALALSGLGATAGCGDPAPAAGAEPTVVDHTEAAQDEAEPDPPEQPRAAPVKEPRPAPCLVPPPADDTRGEPRDEGPPATPRPCLSIAPDRRPDDPEEADDVDVEPTPDDGVPPVRPAPCLSLPRPCLTPPVRQKR